MEGRYMCETELYCLKKKDIGNAKQVLCESFLKDPIFKYILETKLHNETIIKTIQTCNIALGLNYGKVYSPTNRLEGVAIWLPPNHTNISTYKLIRSGILKILTMPGNGIKENMKILDKTREYATYAEEIHEKHASSPHWYLMMIGVRDIFRGKGYATTLIRPILEKCDQEMVPCYLETHNPINVEIYKHFGFATVEDGKLPGSDITHWAMMRMPK
jgi:hypothetical protein